MFDDLKIRNKLVLLVAGPLVIILLLAAFGALDRQQTADENGEVADLVSVARANNDVVDSLQRESLVSTAFVAAGGSGQKMDRSEVDAARKVTDGQMNDAVGRMQANLDTSAGFRSSASLAIEAAVKLPYIREAVDEGYSWDQAADAFNTLQFTFLSVNNTVVGTVGDPQVAGQLRTSSALASYKAALALEGSLLVGVSANVGSGEPGKVGYIAPKTFGELGAYEAFVAANANVGSQEVILNQLSNATDKSTIRSATAGPDLTNLADAAATALVAAKVRPVDFESEAVQEATDNVITSLHAVETDLADQLIADAGSNKSTAERAARFFLIAALVAAIAAAVAAVLLGRRITRPLNNLTVAADRLANEQMPQLVEALKNPSEDEVTSQLSRMKAIEVSSADEIGQLATAFNNVQKVAGEVAAEQAILLRKGIGEMFVNLARRNQALLDRQIEFIDELERSEEDPDQLENLYRLDHLATRMRRNAESLLVLAGAEPPRRRGRPAPLANVVRAALAEVEDFSRIELVSLDEVLVASNSAADIAHLLSELMENATNFSPPETRVEVVGHRTKADGYVISVTDQGIGMSADQITDSNALLARPPLVGLTLSRSLGFIVVGRLAARHGISVKMMPSPSGGATAVVSLPASLVTDGPGSSGLAPSAARPAVAPPHLQPVPAAPTEAPPSSDGLPPLTFQPYETGPTPTPAAPTEQPSQPVEPMAEPASPTPATGAGAPLSFARDHAAEDPAAPSRAPSRSEPTGENVNGLPTRRLSATPAPAPRSAAPEPAAAAPEPPSPPAETIDEPLSGTLDGPPPAAPPLPSRAAAPRAAIPTVSSAPEADGPKPFFLEEADPPRLFGRTPDAAPAAADSPPRLFGGQAPAAPGVPPTDGPPPAPASAPPLARRGAPAAPPAAAEQPTPASPTNGSAPPERTDTGLAKRKPRTSGADRAIPGADGERGVSATRRSPEEVRNLLSRYRDGQQRAKVTEPVPAGPAEETEPDE